MCADDDRRQGRGRRITDLADHGEAFITLEQLAAYLGVERRQVAKWIASNVLPAYQFGARTLRISLSEAVIFVERHRLRPPA